MISDHRRVVEVRRDTSKSSRERVEPISRVKSSSTALASAQPLCWRGEQDCAQHGPSHSLSRTQRIRYTGICILV